MSSPDDVSGLGAGLSSEGGEQGGIRQVSPGGQQGLGLGHDQRAPLSRESEGRLPVPVGLEVKKEVVKATGGFVWCQEDRPGSLKMRDEDDLGYGPCYQDPEDFAVILRQLLHLDEHGRVPRKPSSESCNSHESTLWTGLDKKPIGRSTPVPSNSSGESQHASHTLSVPERGQARGTTKRDPKRSLSTAMDLPRPLIETEAGPSSNFDSSDAYSKRQQMRMRICLKAAGWQENLKDPPRYPTPHVQKNISHTASSFRATTPRRFSSASERQPVEELDGSSMKKTQSSAVWSPRRTRPSYSGATAAGGLPRVTSTRKGDQQKTCPGDASRVVLLRKPPPLPSWGQRFSRGAPEPATLPPIFGIPLLVKPKKDSSAALAPSQVKQSTAEKKPVASRTREQQVPPDKDSERDPVTKALFPTSWLVSTCLPMHRGESSNAKPNTRAPQDSGTPQPLTLNQKPVRSRELILSGVQGPPTCAPRQERQQQLTGEQGCPKCVGLQKEIDDLKGELAALQILADKFQAR